MLTQEFHDELNKRYSNRTASYEEIKAMTIEEFNDYFGQVLERADCVINFLKNSRQFEFPEDTAEFEGLTWEDKI